MKVQLKRKNDAFHFEAMGASGVAVNIDASEDIGGQNRGARPMELLLMGLASCSAIDVLLILKKQRQVVNDVQIEVNGDREAIEGTEMKPFRKIHIIFNIFGSVDPAKAEKAVTMSMTKYCSATAQLQASAEISHSIIINPAL